MVYLYLIKLLWCTTIGKLTLIAENIYRSLFKQLLTQMVRKKKKDFILLVVETNLNLYHQHADILK